MPQAWAFQGADCLAMLHAAGLKNLTGTSAKDLEAHKDHELVKRLLAWRKLRKGDEKDEAKVEILELAQSLGAVKPSRPPLPWNFGSPQQVNELCFDLLGFYLPSTDETSLLRYTEHHPFFGQLLEYRKLKKLAGTYGKDWFKNAYDLETGRVYPGYRQIGTSTGRFASGEREESPNAQNLPRDYRPFFVAPAGRAFVNVDYSQIEVRVVAKMLGVRELLHLFETGEDIYTNTAANLLDLKTEDITKDQRQLAKALVLGMIYGLSAHGLPMYAFKNFGIENMSSEDAGAYVRAFYDLYPEIEDYHENVLSELNENGHVDQRTMTGRLRASITNRNEAINAPVQGTAADGLKAAMAEVYKRLKKFDRPAFIVATLHDELLVECGEEDAGEVLEVVEAAMLETMNEIVNAGGELVPLEVEGRVSKAWAKG